MVKAIARAFRWRKLLETGAYGTVGEIAATEKINVSYIGPVLRLTLLCPDMIECVLDGQQSIALQLDRLLKPFSSEWTSQAQVP